MGLFVVGEVEGSGGWVADVWKLGCAGYATSALELLIEGARRGSGKRRDVERISEVFMVEEASGESRRGDSGVALCVEMRSGCWSMLKL